MPTPLINVSNRLPVTVSDRGIKKSSGGLVTALEGLPREQYDLTWLGWPGGYPAPDRQRGIEDSLREEHGYEPVFLSKKLADAHYEGLSNSSIWPLLHYLPSYFKYRTEWWEAYQQVNEIFAERVLQIAADGQMVWVHDYQLMLLPRLLKSGNPTLKIGFFLHTPFPSSEVFRCHPNREALLEGVLGADLCGFHTFGYLRQFRNSVSHMLGASSEITTIRHDGEQTQLGVYPIGIPAAAFEKEMAGPAILEKLTRLSAEHGGKRLVLSVERLDYTKGILPRLEAIELLLARMAQPERDAIKFMFISIPTRGGVDAYRKLRESVESRVGAINGKFATLHNSPVHFIHGSVNFTELCALYAAADVALVTPLRDGLNLVAKEYVACQRDIGTGGEAAADVAGAPEMASVRATPGALILSEFTGAAEELFSAIMVNPNSPEAVADAIRLALDMPPEERRRRMLPMRQRVLSYDAEAWASDFVRDLSLPHPPQSASLQLSPQPLLQAAIRRLRGAIEAGRRVAMFLDYDGTLREIIKDPFTAKPTPDLTELLDNLVRLKNVELVIISGRTTTDLDMFLGNYSRLTL
ncbi:MAG TPA: trehalose-6-phosphate synthase, partial [Tepidisphaeraceae bacterium]|nr:trehalose-6-phosphate synthase [Tepidisphaeraceae bacterium]